MDNNNILNVRLDLARGAYIISRDNGREEIVKEIKNGNYDKNAMNKRRKEIESMESPSRWIPSDLLKLVDPVLYDALEEFDNKYGTKYRSAYVKAITLQVPYTGVSEMKRERQYQKRAAGIRQEKLEKSGISIEYDVSLLKAAKGIGFMDRIKALRTANAQKAVGAKVNAKQKNPINIIENIKGIRDAISQRISDVRTKRIQKKLELTQKRLEASIPRDENGLIDDVPDLSDEELAAINSGILEKNGVVVPIEEPKTSKQAPQSPVIPDPKAQGPIIIPDPIVVPPTPAKADPVLELDSEEEHPEQPSVQEPKAKPEPAVAMPQQPKKEMSRSKSRQAAKKAARDAGKMKNNYQDRIKAKADARVSAEEGRKKAEAKRAEDAEKAAEAARLQMERQKIEKAIRIQERNNQAKAKREAEEAARALNEKKLSTRLTRKLKNVQESIRNKVHIPDFNGYKREITRAVTLAVEKAKNMKKEATIRFTRKLRSIEDSIRNKVHIPNLTEQKKRIAGTLTVVALAATLGLGVAATFANADANVNEAKGVQPTAPIVEVMEGSGKETPGPEQLVYRDIVDKDQKQDEHAKPDVGQVAQTNPEEKSAEDLEREYLSSIRVGSNLKIESGKYFESPDGTGNFGHFENYQDGLKEITIIGITTSKGYIVVKDPNVSLYDLKQQYPDGKFTYHFVCRHPDGRTTTLGWLTENSMEQNIEIETPAQADEGR